MTQPDIYTVEARRRSAEEHGKDGDVALLVTRILRGDYDTDPDQRAIAATLRELNWQPPVDPDLVEARKIAATMQKALGADEGIASAYYAGRYDDGHTVSVALAAIKRGRELERGA
jgi:hypothetical protein